MCGIAGFSGKFNPDLLEKMNRSISHRGPDDQGTYYMKAIIEKSKYIGYNDIKSTFVRDE